MLFLLFCSSVFSAAEPPRAVTPPNQVTCKTSPWVSPGLSPVTSPPGTPPDIRLRDFLKLSREELIEIRDCFAWAFQEDPLLDSANSGTV